MAGPPIVAAAAAAADDVLITPDTLHGHVVRIFAALGSDTREAKLVADHLVLANRFGHDSHGISLVPLYVRMLREGKVKPNTRVSVVADHGSTLTLEAHRGLGQATAQEAMELAIARAQAHGNAVVALRNSHHVARIGHWAEQCAAAGLVSVHFVNAIHAPPVVAPYAGADARLHTNPFAVGVPRRGQVPIILDFATSLAAQGKMRVAMNRGQAVPEGYLLDAAGQPTTDPAAVYADPLGALLRFGDHKGAGLGLLCDIMAGALSGAGTLHPGTMEDGVYCNNMLSLVLDPARLGGAASWVAEIEAGAAFLQQSPPRPGMGPVLLPGQAERITAAARDRNGIPVDRTTWSLLCDAARDAGVALSTPPPSAPQAQ